MQVPKTAVLSTETHIESSRSMHTVVSFDAARDRLAEALRCWESGLGERRPLRVLEAGGGSLSQVRFEIPAEITVIDISREQLARNEGAARKIHGDLHVTEIGRDKYDCVVCWNVIEHLHSPARVMLKLFRAVAPGGIVLIAAPNRNSLAGLITAFSPHWFHVAVMKHIFNVPTAGLPGYPPFRSFHRPEIAPARIMALAAQQRMDIVMFQFFESGRRTALKRNSPMTALAYEAALGAGMMLTRAPLHASDMIVLLQRPVADEFGKCEAG
jgi:SAM-dependent methyltransferase